MGKSVFRTIAKGLLGRLAAYGGLALGFWLLFQGFQSGNLRAGIPFGLAGGATILIGMYLMVAIRGLGSPVAPVSQGKSGNEEDGNGDPVTGSNQSG